MIRYSEVKLLSLVVPCHNESAAIRPFFASVMPILEAMEDVRFEIVCVNDGSTDDTLERLAAVARRDMRVRVIDLTRNFGKEAAMTAGIDEALGDAVIPIDADLQDPPALIPLLVEKWRAGAEVVLAQRRDRRCDSLLKRIAATAYYRVHNRLSELKLPENVGDFRLMDRVVVNALKQLPERRRFMKGLFAWVGFRTEIVTYERQARCAGTPSSPAGDCGTSRWRESPASARCLCASGPISARPLPSSRSGTACSSPRAHSCSAWTCQAMPRSCACCCSSAACS